MLKIGITGGFATGKTTFCNILRELSYPVFSADECVRHLYTLPQVQKKILSTFGKKAFFKGKINKAYILKKITESRDLKKRLEEIFHPLVKKELLKFFKEAEKNGYWIAFAEVPLLFEAGWRGLFDEVWVVFCSEELQLKRAIERGLTPEEVKAFLRLQLPLREKAEMADRVFSSEIPIEELKTQVQEALKELKLKAQSLREE